jgi:hypothetical protein
MKSTPNRRPKKRRAVAQMLDALDRIIAAARQAEIARRKLNNQRRKEKSIE